MNKNCAVLLSVLLIVVADPVPDVAVGTCSLQAGELLPDPPCYDNCKDTPDQRHFLTCIEMACHCRETNPPNPQDVAVPLNAGAVSDLAQNTTTTTVVPSPDTSSGNSSSVVTPLNAGDVSSVAANGTVVLSNNVTAIDVPPANGTSISPSASTESNAVTTVSTPMTSPEPAKP